MKWRRVSGTLDFETYAQRSPFSLSGGQMRRAAIAGVVAMNPDYLILDEPSAGLDPGSRDAVFAEIMVLYKKRGIGIIMVTHSMEEAAKYAKRMLVVYKGEVILDGKPGEIFLKEKNRLLEAGMDIPEVYKLADALRAKGLRLPYEITDAKRLLAEVKRRKGLKYPGNSFIHRLDPRTKILTTLILIVAVFLANSAIGYATLCAMVLFIIAVSGLPFMLVLKSVKPLLFIIVLTLVLHAVMGQGEHVLYQWKFIKVTEEGLQLGVQMAMRLILLLMISSILTFTTSPIVLTDGRIIKAQTARGADFSGGNLLARAKNMLPILVPLFISAFRRADDLAIAMEARCYRGGEGRTRMHQLAYRSGDGLAFVFAFAMIGLLAFLRWGPKFI